MSAARRGSAAKTAEPAPAGDEAENSSAVQPETDESAPAELAGAALGGIAYLAYRDAVGGHAVNGDELPDWDDLVANNRNVAAAWCAAAQAALVATFERKQA